MFWRFGILTQTAIDTLLENEEVTLEEVLDEEELLQECKAHNRKLIEFLCKPETLEALLKYIVEKPADDLDESVKYRYPCLAAEIFGCEVLAICEALIRNEALLTDFWKFLDSPDPMNPIQGSYFCRVFGILLQKKTLETIRFIQAQEKAVDKIIAHIETSAFMDLLLKLITCEETKEGQGIVDWLLDNGLVPKLIDKLDPELSDEIHLNVGQSIVDILNVVHNYGTKNPVLTHLKGGAVASTLFGHLVKTNAPNHTTSLLGGFSILIELIHRALGFVVEGETPVIDFQEEDLTEFMAALEPHLEALHNIMLNATPPPYVETVPGKQPLGSVRLKMIEFFIIILHANNPSVNKKLLELNVIPCYIDLFFKYQWNNFLHSLVQIMIEKIFSSELDNSHAIMINVLREGRLTEKIVEAAKENDIDVDSRGGVRRGYMGHLVLIANHLSKFSQLPDMDQEVAAYFEAEQWKEFENSSLAETNQRDNKPLGGHRPVAVSDEMFHSGMDDTSADQYSDDDFEMDDEVIEKPNFAGDGGFKSSLYLDDSDSGDDSAEEELDSPQTRRLQGDDDDDDEEEDEEEASPKPKEEWANFDQANFSQPPNQDVAPAAEESD